MSGPDDLEARLERESLRLCRRYVDEIVLAFDLCPWAATSLREDRVQIIIITREINSLTEVDEIARDAALRLEEAARAPSTELVLLVFPRARLPRLAFDDLLRAVRRELSAASSEPPFALAAFHPDAPADRASPERFIPFLRRSPDPLLQAVRSDVLARLEPVQRSGTGFVDPADLLALLDSTPPRAEPLRVRIARANLETVERVGLATFSERLEDILRDRARTYEALFGEGPRPGASTDAPPSAE